MSDFASEIPIDYQYRKRPQDLIYLAKNYFDIINLMLSQCTTDKTAQF